MRDEGRGDFYLGDVIEAAQVGAIRALDPDFGGRAVPGWTTEAAQGALDDLVAFHKDLVQWRRSPVPPTNTLPTTAVLLVEVAEPDPTRRFRLLSPPSELSLRAIGEWPALVAVDDADILRWMRLQ